MRLSDGRRLYGAQTEFRWTDHRKDAPQFRIVEEFLFIRRDSTSRSDLGHLVAPDTLFLVVATKF